MRIQFGNGSAEYGCGVQIDLTADEVVIAINAYLVAHGVHIFGARTTRVNGEMCEGAGIYVDPSGSVIAANGKRWTGSGEIQD